MKEPIQDVFGLVECREAGSKSSVIYLSVETNKGGGSDQGIGSSIGQLKNIISK